MIRYRKIYESTRDNNGRQFSFYCYKDDKEIRKSLPNMKDFLIGGICIAVVCLMCGYVTINPIIRLVISIAISFVTYFVTLFMMKNKIVNDGLKVLYKMIRRDK